MSRLEAAGGPIARRLLVAQLKPRLEPLLEDLGLRWEDAAPVLQVAGANQDRLREAVDDPASFLRRLEAAGGPVACRLLIGKLRPRLEPLLTRRGMTWEDTLPVLEMVESHDELCAAATHTLLATLLRAPPLC